MTASGAAVVKRWRPNSPWFADLGSRRRCREVLWAPRSWTQVEHPYHPHERPRRSLTLCGGDRALRLCPGRCWIKSWPGPWIRYRAGSFPTRPTAASWSVGKRLQAPLEPFYENMERYGNTSAGTIPIALDEMAERGLLQRGQWVLCRGLWRRPHLGRRPVRVVRPPPPTPKGRFT